MKNILYQFIEGQTQFGMQRCAEVNFGPPMDPNRLLFIQIKIPPSLHHHKWKVINDIVCKKTKIVGDKLLSKRHIELKDN